MTQDEELDEELQIKTKERTRERAPCADTSVSRGAQWRDLRPDPMRYLQLTWPPMPWRVAAA